MAEPTYCTREQVARATDAKPGATADEIIDRKIQGASRDIELQYHRRFYPLLEARSYDLGSGGSGTIGFWLEADLISVVSVTVDGTTVDLDDVTLTPAEYGPPYSGIDLVSPGGTTVVITGLWGYSDDEAAAGALDAAIATTSATTCTVTNAALIGVGDLIHIDNERLLVTGRGLATTTATITANVDTLASTVTIPVSSGALVNAGETITIDAERMLVIDVAGNNLIVRRAVDGSVIAAHTSGATVYAARLLTIERGSAGTTAATHADGTTVTRNVPPGPINELVLAETIAALQQDQAGWARTAGTGAAAQGVAPEGLEQMRSKAEVFRRYRMRAI